MTIEKGPQSVVLADLIRLSAAAIVMFNHLALQSWHNPESGAAAFLDAPARYEWAVPFTWFGWVGVQIFFVLSGFIIAFSLRGTAADFARRRFLRLYPGAWVCVAISFALVAALTAQPLSETVMQALRSAALWPHGDWIVGVYWTLPVELAFYFLMGLLLKYRGSVSLAMFALTVVSGLYWAAAFLDLMPPLPDWLTNLLLFTYGANFALGALIYTIGQEGPKPLLVIGALGAAAVSAVSILPKAFAKAAEHGQFFLVPVLVWLAAVVALLLAIRFNGWASRVFGTRWTRQAGLMTYPLYLLHIPVGAAAMNYTGLAGGVIAAVVVSYVVALWAEPKLREQVKSLIAPVRRQSPQTL